MDLMLTLSVSLVVALVLGYITQRLGLSPIVGYLLAGIIVGPNTPGFIANHEIAEQLAEIGVVLLMFGVGIHFDIKDLLGMRHVALPGAAVQSATATLLGAVAAVNLGWGHDRIGYGPVGRTVVRLLRANDVSATVVELNLKTVKALRAEGIRVIRGDARQRETLEGAGIATAARSPRPAPISCSREKARLHLP